MDDIGVQVVNVVGSFMLAAALQAAGVPAPFLTLVIGSYQVVPSITYTTQQLGDVAVLSILNSTYTTTATPTIPLAAVNTTNFTALAQKVPASSINLDFFIIERFFDKSALETAILRKQQSRLSKLVAQEARAAWSVVEDSTSTVPSTPAALQALPIGAAELILLVISVIVITSAVVYIRICHSARYVKTDEPQSELAVGKATRPSNAEAEIDCGAPPAVPTSTVDDERVLDDAPLAQDEQDNALEASPRPDQPPQIANAVEDPNPADQHAPQPIPGLASFDGDTNHPNQSGTSSPSPIASPTSAAEELTSDDYDLVALEDTFISLLTPQDSTSPLNAVAELVTSDQHVASNDEPIRAEVDNDAADEMISSASSNQSLLDEDVDELFVSGPRELDQDTDAEDLAIEDSSFAKADVDCADDEESEAEDMPDDALIPWNKSLEGHMSPNWFEYADEETDNSESDASDKDNTSLDATSEDVEAKELAFESPVDTTLSPVQPFPFADTDDLAFLTVDLPDSPAIEDDSESPDSTPEDVDNATTSPTQRILPIPTNDGPQSDNELTNLLDGDDLSESSVATSEDSDVATPSPTVSSLRMDDDVKPRPDIEVVNAQLVETLETLKAKSCTSPPAVVIPVASPVTSASHSLMHLLPSATHSEPEVSSEAEPSPALQRVFDKLQASARATGLEGASEPEDKTNDEALESVDLDAEPMLEKVDEALVASTEDMEQVYAEENELADQDASLDSAPSTKQEDRPASPVSVDEMPSIPEPAAEPEPVSPASEPTAPSVSSSPTPGEAQDECSTDDIIAAELKRHANNLDPENQRRIHGLPPPEVQKPVTDVTTTPPKSTAALSNPTVSLVSSSAVPVGLPTTTIYSTAPPIVPTAPSMAPTTTPMAVTAPPMVLTPTPMVPTPMPMAPTAPTMVPSTTPTQPISVCGSSPRRPRVNYPPRLDQQAPLVPPGLSRNVGPCGPVPSRVHPGPQAFRGPQQAPAFNQRPLAFNAAPQPPNLPSHGLRAMNPTAPPFAPGPPRGMREFAPHQVPPPPHLQGPPPFNGMHRLPQQMPPQMMHEMPPPPGIPMPPPPGLQMPRPPQVSLNGMPPQQQPLGPPQQRFLNAGQHFSPVHQMPRLLGMHGPGPQQLSAGPPRFANLAPQGQAFQGPSPTFQGPPPPMPFPPGLGPMHQEPSPMHQARPPMLLGPEGHPPMPAFDGPPPVMFDGPSPAVSILPGFSPMVSPFRPSLQMEEFMRPAPAMQGLFAVPPAPGPLEAPEVPPGLPAPAAPPGLPAPAAPAADAHVPAPAPVPEAPFLPEDARFRSLEADRVSGAASVAPRPAHPRVQSPDAPERPASAPPVTPETVDTTPEMISGVLKWREGGEVRRAVLQSPEDWVTSPKSFEGAPANREQTCDAGLQAEVEVLPRVEHDATTSEAKTTEHVPMPSSASSQQEPNLPASQRRRPRHRQTIFVLGCGLPARATHR